MVKWTAVWLAASACAAAMAQGSGDPGQQAPVYTLGTTSRLVVEDVLVTDAHGAPVRNLPESAFHVLDNEVEQKITGFEAGGGERRVMVPQAPKPAVFSNAATVNPGGQVVVLLVDNVSMEVPDQMYLRVQMLRYLQSMPAGIDVAVFKANGGRRPLLVQPLTTDHDLLRKAIERSVPAFPLTTSAQFSDALSEVANISEYLEQVPGRKQLVWFAGRFPLYESPLSSNGAGDEGLAQEQLKLAYRLLERARVEVYPIDVRGVTLGGSGLNVAANPAAGRSSSGGAGGSSAGASVLGESAKDAGSYSTMNTLAANTGGRAFYSTNELTQAIASAVALGNETYTLSYRPSQYQQDGRWHSVKVKVDGGFRLSYRKGYNADEPAGAASRRELLAVEDLKKHEGEAAEDAAEQAPIRFEARLREVPASGGKIKVAFALQYGITASDLVFVAGETGDLEARIDVAAMACDRDGGILSSTVKRIKTHFSEQQREVADRTGIPVEQQIGVPKNAEYLLLAIFDERSGRAGMVQMTLSEAKAAER